MADNQVITAFQDGTTCETLIHRIGRVKSKTIRKLLDLATDHTNGDEVSLSARGSPRRNRVKLRLPVRRTKQRKSASSAATTW
jgi:hypothetical protein